MSSAGHVEVVGAPSKVTKLVSDEQAAKTAAKTAAARETLA
jgi:hypothetical protein